MLEIPEQAVVIARDYVRNDESDENDPTELARTILDDCAPMIVAAELRRLAALLESWYIFGPIDRESAAYMLRTRADQLEKSDVRR